MNKQKYIKYFFGSFRKAHSIGLSNEYMFYLKLKTIHSGYVNRGVFIKQLQLITTYSSASISNYTQKLIKCKFIIPIYSKNKVKGYRIQSYQKVFRLIGYKTKFTGKNKNIAKEYKFKRILISDLKVNKDFKDYIFSLEIYNNSEKQSFKIKDKLKRKINYHKETLDKNPIKKQNKIDQLNIELKSALTIKEFNISCKKVSLLLGYKSVQQGSLIERKLEKKSLLNINRSNTFLKKSSFIDFLINRKNNQYWMFGNIIEIHCNELSIGSCFLNFLENNKQKHFNPNYSLI